MFKPNERNLRGVQRVGLEVKKKQGMNSSLGGAGNGGMPSLDLIRPTDQNMPPPELMQDMILDKRSFLLFHPFHSSPFKDRVPPA